jgi:hypothetical protein
LTAANFKPLTFSVSGLALSHAANIFILMILALLVLASLVFHGSESLGTRDHILISKSWDFPFRRLLRLSGSRWRYSTSPPHGFMNATESESELCYDRRSVAQSAFEQSTHLGLTTTFYYRRTVAGLLMWGALSDERTDPSFTIAADPRQRSHSWVRVPWDSRPYFTVSHLRLPFSSPPTTRRATV